MRRQACTRSARGRRSVRRGKAFEREVARRLNERLGTRYRRNRLGLGQPFGDLVPDYSQPIGAGQAFESHYYIECKSNLEFAWGTLLAGMPCVLDRVLREARGAAEQLVPKMLVPPACAVIFVGHERAIYAMMSLDDLNRFSNTAGISGWPMLQSAGKVILTLDSFLELIPAIAGLGAGPAPGDRS